MNLFIFLENKRRKINNWLKNKTTIDFSDWGVLILFLLGLFVIFYFINYADVGSIISSIVLWFTAIVIIQYTKETYWLKQINIKQLNYQKRPILKITTDGDWACSFMLKNIGKGPALNIELRISQIHPNGGFTNLQNLANDSQRKFFNLGDGEAQSTTSFCEILDDYIKAKKDDFLYGVKGVFSIIATYEDVDRNPYYTIILLKIITESSERYILKTIKTGNYKSGELDKIVPTDWLK